MSNFLSVEDLAARYATLSEAEKVMVTAIFQARTPGRQGVTAATAEAALALIDSVELLRVLTPEERGVLAERLEEVPFSTGAFMVQEGARDNCLYLIAEGQAEVRVTIEGSNVARPVARLGDGDFFGEMALLTGEPRKASVIADGPVRAFRLIKEDFDDLLRGRPEIVEGFAAILARRMVELQAVQQERFALLDRLPEDERNALMSRLRPVAFAAGDVIVRQGSDDRWMGIMVSGEADVRAEHEGSGTSRRVASLGVGDFFGEMSLLAGEPRSATIVAKTPVSCYVLDAEAFEAHLLEYPTFRERLERIREERTAELLGVRTGLDEDVERQRIRKTETRFARRIRRFFSLDRPAKKAEKVLTEPRSRLVTGKVLFEYHTPSGEDKPLHNMYLELWHRDMIEVFLGCATSARDGSFEIWFDPSDIGGKVNPELRVFEEDHFYTAEGELQLTRRLVFTVPGERGLDTPSYDMGEVRVPYWEYDPNNPMPRALIVEQGDPPQTYPPGRSMLMLKMIAPIEVIKQKHLLEFRMSNGEGPSIDKIQKAYPENLTRRLERERPGYTRSDEYFGERLLNGMSASIFDKDESHPNRYRIYHHWNSYEQDGIHALPNVDMRFEVRNERLYPVEITLWMRKPGVTEANAPTEKMTFTPNDGEKWLQAKRVARVSAAMVAELDNHLTTTHLNTEQYAIAAYRNLRKNPVRFLLFPHLKEVVLIDHSADSFLLGPNGYVTRASALTDEATKLRIRQVMGTLDWKNYRPLQPICETHTYAKAANLFWDVLGEYIDEFFEQHGEEIVKHWYEVHMFSKDLVEHSAPDFLCRYLTSTVAGKPESARSWFSAEERMDLSVPRYVVNGVPRAVQPVTLSDIPLPSDIENLKQVCRYTIHHSTFKHTWANARQYDDGGEIVYNALGLRYGKNSVFGPESDHDIAPPPDRATELLWISCMLSRAVYGYITRNEDRDIDPAFVEMLERHRGDFAALDVDIDTIQSRTNI
jgi:CRP-like cAMP-binding protein